MNPQNNLRRQYEAVKHALQGAADLGIPNSGAEADWVIDGGLPSLAERPAKALLKHVKALSGKSPGTVRCYDTGASQGMDEEGPGAYDGEKIPIQTGNDIVTSHRWRRVEIAPGTFMRHIVLPHTARTVSIGDLNAQCGVGFKWIEPDRKGNPG